MKTLSIVNIPFGIESVKYRISQTPRAPLGRRTRSCRRAVRKKPPLRKKRGGTTREREWLLFCEGVNVPQGGKDLRHIRGDDLARGGLQLSFCLRYASSGCCPSCGSHAQSVTARFVKCAVKEESSGEQA